VDEAACRSILERVREMIGAPEGESSAAETGGISQPRDQGQGDRSAWRIVFSPGPEMMQNGANPVLLLRELRQLGDLTVQARMEGLPPLAELVAERCYVSWEMTLETSAGQDAIRDVFIFVEDTCELTIEAVREREAGLEADLIARALGDKRAATGGRRTYDKPDSASTLRVPAVKLDQFVDLVGELVTVQARLTEIAARRDDAEFTAVAEEIERLTSSLRETSMSVRMMPIRGTFEKFRRLIHDLARDLGKDVELTMEGADTELDKTVVDQLSDPLMHLIRNSMDHGIEPAEVRVARGKRPAARIHLSARHAGASVLVAVSDDGGGIDFEAVRNRAVAKGLISAEAELTDAETSALIFEPGFSTARQVTDISGRGVGMDVVRKSVDGLHGTIDVASKRGAGTCVTLRLPLTLAIIDGLLVSLGDAYFVLPLANTLECIELSAEDLERANGNHVANVRDEIVPYIRLREYFGICTKRPAIEQIMIVETEEGRFGFVVDKVLGDCQTVIKNLGRFYRHVQVVSGATILGNGKVALILDPYRLVQEALQAKSLGSHGRADATRGSPKGSRLRLAS
jgi:two-component system chemotaxis sensor kinase CheA